MQNRCPLTGKSLNCVGKEPITFRSRRHPLFQPLEIEQSAHLGIVIRHSQQKLSKSPDPVRRHAVENREVAVIVRRRFQQPEGRSWCDGPVLLEQPVVALDEASRIDAMMHQRQSGLALAADVIAVLTDQDVE